MTGNEEGRIVNKMGIVYFKKLGIIMSKVAISAKRLMPYP